MGKTIEIPIELASCIKCDKELPTYIDMMKGKLGSVRKVCEHIEQVTDGGLKANTVRQAYKRQNGVGTFVPKKSEGQTIPKLGTVPPKSQKTDVSMKVVRLGAKACCTPKFVEWQPFKGIGWYSGFASNKVRSRCDELHLKFNSLHLEMIKFFRNDASVRKEKLLREDWNRVQEEVEHFATWLLKASGEMGKAAGLKSKKRADIG